MADFFMNPTVVIQQAGRLENVQASVNTVREIVQNSCDGLSSIGLEKIVPTMEALNRSLGQRVTSVNQFQTKIREIVNKYYRAESNITAHIKPATRIDKLNNGNDEGDTSKWTDRFDVNGDGVIDFRDAIAYLNRFDVDGDGDIDQLDGLLALAQWAEERRQEMFDSVCYVDEDGIIHYDMDSIEYVLGMDPDDVPDEVYDRIALAYTCMDAEEIEDMMLAMMERDKDVDYPWYNELFGYTAGLMNEDYTSWVLNDDVYDEMTAAMSRLTQGNLALINYCDQMYSETNNPAWLEMARNGNDYRMNLVQREAMLDAIGNVEDFHGTYEGDKPYFDVDQRNDGTFVIEFNEWRNVGSTASPVFSNYGESTITIDPCLDGTTFAIQDTETVELMLHNQYAAGFTSDGFESDEACAQFWVEHLLGYGYANAENAILNTLPDAYGYGTIATHAVYDGIMDYVSGTENAAFVSGVGDHLQTTEIYEVFDCDVVAVHYNASDMPSTALYAEAGRYTNQRIDYYNSNYDTSSITTNDLIHHPVDICEDMINIIDDGGSFEELANTIRW